MDTRDKYDVLRLENQLCFPLYVCAREVVKLYKPYLDEIGLTYTQYITMMVMWEHERLNVKEAGEYLHLDSGTLTPVLKKLEEKGLVARNRSDKDERNLIVTLTDAGEELKDAAVSIPERVGSCIRMEPEKAGMLYEMLYELAGSIR